MSAHSIMSEDALSLMSETEYCIAGIARLPFAAAAERLRRVQTRYVIRRFLVWDYSGEINESTAVGDGRLSDFEGILTFDFDSIKLASAEFETAYGVERIIVTLSRYGNYTHIDGDVPLGAFTEGTSRETASERVASIAGFLRGMAVQMHACVLGIGNDYAAAELEGLGIAAPTLLAIYPAVVVAQAERDLRALGATVDEQPGGYSIVWLGSEYLPNESEECRALLERLARTGCENVP